MAMSNKVCKEKEHQAIHFMPKTQGINKVEKILFQKHLNGNKK
jgi:hypothetical protein